MPRGGARPGSGPKPKPKPEPIADKGTAARLIEALNRPASGRDSEEIRGWRLLWEAQDLRIRLDVRKYLYDKRDGKPVQRTEVTGRDSGAVQAEIRFVLQPIGEPANRAVIRGSDQTNGPPTRRP